MMSVSGKDWDGGAGAVCRHTLMRSDPNTFRAAI